MLGRTYDHEVCSAARALEVVGERWTLLLLRNAAFVGHTRFNQLQESLGIAPNVLSARLQLLVAEGLMEGRGGEGGAPEYFLTEKGRDFVPVLVALTAWGDRWAAPDGPPIAYQHAGCGGTVRPSLTCEGCGAEVPSGSVTAWKTASFAKARARRPVGAVRGEKSARSPQK